LPAVRIANRYQLREAIGLQRGSHSLKLGFDFAQQDASWFAAGNIRGRLVYNTLQDLVDDVAHSASITPALPGGEPWAYFRYRDYFFFVQDEWRIRPNLTLSYGIRYESPGNPAANLANTRNFGLPEARISSAAFC